MLAVALLVAACSSGNAAEDNDHGVLPIEDSEPPTDDGPEEPVPDPDDDAADEPDTEPEPEDPDPFAIPDEIDEAYVDLVMNELLAIDSAVLRDVLARDPGSDLEEEDFERLREIYSGPQLAKNAEDYSRYASDSDSRRAFHPPDKLGEIRWTTRRIMEAGPDCIVAIGSYDLAGVSVAPYEDDEHSMTSLAPIAEERRDDQVHSAAPWRLHDLILVTDADGEPVPEENWDRLNYAPVLERTCAQEDDA